MKLISLILLGLIFSFGVLNAQTDFRPGYIIKNSGDTLYGEIDHRGDLLMGRLCKFKNNENIITDYFPNDITAFRFIDSKFYVSREVNGKSYFLEYLIKGEINIYYMRDDDGDHYFLDKQDVKLTEIPYEEGIKYVEDKKVYYESTKHIGLLSVYMQDAPKLQSQIQSFQKPEHQNLIKLAEAYHNEVCKDELCIIYEKPAPFLKVLPELIGGAIKFSKTEGLNDKFYTHTGVIGHIWMPRTSEKMYFRTGLLFSQLDFETGSKNYYKIPVQLEYIFPRGILRPRVAYGLNFYIPGYRTVSLDIGTNLKLSKTFFLSLTSDVEFNPIMVVVPRGNLISYSFKLGLFLNI